MLKLQFFQLKLLVLALLIVDSFSSYFHASSQCPADEKEQWTYRGSKGPKKWGESYKACRGFEQSPIEICSGTAKVDNSIAPLTFSNYDKPILKAKLENNGHSIEVIPEDGVERTCTVNGDKFYLHQFHFHWGRNYKEGSEHVVDGLRYPMEMHLVHKNEEDIISVVAILFYQEKSRNSNENKELQTIVDELPDLMFKDDFVELEIDMNLSNLLPDNLSFYRYNGSLTTPGCAEGVIWSVFTQPIPVGSSQMSEFRLLYSVPEDTEDYRGCLLAGNYRPVQPLNKRQVYLSQ